MTEPIAIFVLSAVVGFLGARWLIKRRLEEENGRYRSHQSPHPPKELAHFDGR